MNNKSDKAPNVRTIQFDELPESLRNSLSERIRFIIQLMLVRGFELREQSASKSKSSQMEYRLYKVTGGNNPKNCLLSQKLTEGTLRNKFGKHRTDFLLATLQKSPWEYLDKISAEQASNGREVLPVFLRLAESSSVEFGRLKPIYAKLSGASSVPSEYVVLDDIVLYWRKSGGLFGDLHHVLDGLCDYPDIARSCVARLLLDMDGSFLPLNNLLKDVPAKTKTGGLSSADAESLTYYPVFEALSRKSGKAKGNPSIKGDSVCYRIRYSNGVDVSQTVLLNQIIGNTPQEIVDFFVMVAYALIAAETPSLTREIPNDFKNIVEKINQPFAKRDGDEILLRESGPIYKMFDSWITNAKEHSSFDATISIQETHVSFTFYPVLENIVDYRPPFRFFLRDNHISVKDVSNHTVPVVINCGGDVPTIRFSDDVSFPWVPSEQCVVDDVMEKLKQANWLWTEHEAEIARYKNIHFEFSYTHASVSVECDGIPPVKAGYNSQVCYYGGPSSDSLLAHNVDHLLDMIQYECGVSLIKAGLVEFPVEYTSPLFHRVLLSLSRYGGDRWVTMTDLCKAVKSACPEVYTTAAIRSAVDLALSWDNLVSVDGICFGPFTKWNRVETRKYSFYEYQPVKLAHTFAQHVPVRELSVADFPTLTKKYQAYFIYRLAEKVSTSDEVMTLVPLLEQMPKVFRKSFKKTYQGKFNTILVDPSDQILLETVLDS